MVFEPGYLKVQPGDTVASVQKIKVTLCTAKRFLKVLKNSNLKKIRNSRITLDKEGVYVYTCPVHRSMNMNGVIQVGDNLPNKEQAEKVVKES